MFTLGQPAVDGYVPYGSLFRGSGSWVVKPTLLPSGGISDHGAVAIGNFIYMFGGAAVNANVTAQPLNGACFFNSVERSRSVPALLLTRTPRRQHVAL
jgi:hypothetical protein